MSLYALLADGILLLHAAFVLFAVAGGLLVIRWPRLAWAHLPAAGWAALVEFMGWICPLTPLEDNLRMAAGERVHGGDFLERLLLPLLYPEWLTRSVQVVLGLVVVLVNVLAYSAIVVRRRRTAGSAPARRRARTGGPS